MAKKQKPEWGEILLVMAVVLFFYGFGRVRVDRQNEARLKDQGDFEEFTWQPGEPMSG